MLRLALCCILLCSGCEDAAAPPKNDLGRATGLFSTIPIDRTDCSVLTILGTSIQLMFLPTDEKLDGLSVQVPPFTEAKERFIVHTALEYGAGQKTPLELEVERGHELLDPRLEGDAAAVARESRTSFYMPFWVHRAKAKGAHLCNADVVTGELRLDDCFDVPDSSMEDAFFWCSVGTSTPPEFTQ